eukprot:scaffold31356_cov69-Phaeocystis_antarctica.AAC.1
METLPPARNCGGATVCTRRWCSGAYTVRRTYSGAPTNCGPAPQVRMYGTAAALCGYGSPCPHRQTPCRGSEP